jgi:CRISPR-associated protein Cas2
MHHQHYMLCYDICDPKRLNRVHRAVAKVMMQIQYSVYYAEVMPKVMETLVEHLSQIIDPKKDDIRVYGVEPLADAIRLGRCGMASLALFDAAGRASWGGTRTLGWDDNDEV